MEKCNAEICKFYDKDYRRNCDVEWKDCQHYEMLTAGKAPVAKLQCSDVVMPDGHYWINDPSRYGWEVVRILGGNLYRFGVREECNLDKNKFEFAKIDEPEKA